MTNGRARESFGTGCGQRSFDIRRGTQTRSFHTMKIKTLAFTLGLAAALATPLQHSFAADEDSGKPMANAMEKKFIKKAADGGMTEVELGKLAGEKGGSSEVKDFGNEMVTDHTKINDNLKEVATKLNVTIPDKINAKHMAMVDKMSGMSGADFDKAYVPAMVKAHKKDIADFEEASKEVKNEDLKKFIDDSIPMMKDHLEKIQKFDQAKASKE
jgi:putative membrane protein